MREDANALDLSDPVCERIFNSLASTTRDTADRLWERPGRMASGKSVHAQHKRGTNDVRAHKKSWSAFDVGKDRFRERSRIFKPRRKHADVKPPCLAVDLFGSSFLCSQAKAAAAWFFIAYYAGGQSGVHSWSLKIIIQASRYSPSTLPQGEHYNTTRLRSSTI